MYEAGTTQAASQVASKSASQLASQLASRTASWPQPQRDVEKKRNYHSKTLTKKFAQVCKFAS